MTNREQLLTTYMNFFRSKERPGYFNIKLFIPLGIKRSVYDEEDLGEVTVYKYNDKVIERGTEMQNPPTLSNIILTLMDDDMYLNMMKYVVERV
jgi:hypothetical protein